MRSDAQGLRTWLTEERNTYREHAEAVGGAMSHQIVSVWLIGVSLFKRGEGPGDFGDIELADDSGMEKVY